MEQRSTILIVDDNLAGRETLKGLLYGRGYDLAFASNGMEALEKAAAITPDLILLDVMMPGMDGFEVCHRLRNNPKIAEVPVIMVTALDDRDSLLRGIEAGADDFVSKPFDHAELRKRVETITRLNRYRRLVFERTKFEWVVEQADDGYIIINDLDQLLYANSQARLYLNLPTDTPNLPTQTFLNLVQKYYNCEPFTAWSVWPKDTVAHLPRYLVRPASPTTNPFWLKADIIQMNLDAANEHLVRLRDVTTKISEQRSMWTFHGQVSHKLRTPLNHLFASLDMITDKDLACVEPDIRTFFEIAKHGASRLKDEIHDIFQYIEASTITRTDTDSCHLNQIPEILDEINVFLNVQVINTSFKGSASFKNHKLTLSYRAVELIFWELLENAKKFHPRQSPTLDIESAIDEAGQQLIIKVSDDGITLPPDQLEKMWTPYYQAEKYFTGQVHGTGLGLSTVTSLIWNVGGTCNAYNRIDKPGLTVELKIPLYQQIYEASDVAHYPG